MKPTIQVTLHGATGTKTTKVETKGFSNRHVSTRNGSTPPGLIPSIFDDTMPEPRFAREDTGTAYQTNTKPENPLGDKLKALIETCDAKLKPHRSPAHQAQMDRCFAYLNERASERERYEKHNDVPAKRENALARLAEIQEVS